MTPPKPFPGGVEPRPPKLKFLKKCILVIKNVQFQDILPIFDNFLTFYNVTFLILIL